MLTALALLQGGYCRVGLRLNTQPNNPLQCTASDCAFKAGSTEVQCKSTACSCAQPDAAGNCGPPGAHPLPKGQSCWTVQ